MKQLHFFTSNTSFRSFKDQFDLLTKNRQAIALIRLSFLLLGISWILVGLFYNYFPPQIPLLFTKPWGESQIVEKKFIFLIPSLLTLFFIINHRLASISAARDKLLSYIFLISHLLISFLGLTTLVRLIILLA